jgi:hypothetical protein
MRLVTVALGAALVLGLTLSPLYAAPGGPKAPKAPKSAGAPKTPKPTATKAPKATRSVASTKPVSGKANVAKRSTARSTSSASLTTPTTTTTGVDFTQGKVGERLARNSALRSKLEAQLTALGYAGTVYQAGYGFKNQGQMVAAINNAQNQGVSFEQLKVLMTGLSVDSTGAVLRANRNPDGTVTMLPVDEVTNPAPTQSLGQAKKTLATEATTTGTGTATVRN